MMNHLFECYDGALYDTRMPNWSSKPLRKVFKRTFSEIKNVAEFKSTLRAGPYTWAGGYPLYLICNDGETFCFDCARKEARHIMESISTNARDGYHVVATDVNYEDTDLYCDSCSVPIESAYD